MNWQPIETAPKSQTVLVGFGHARYIAYQTDQPAPMVNTWRHENGTQLPDWPTHWMPLPLPPARSVAQDREQPWHGGDALDWITRAKQAERKLAAILALVTRWEARKAEICAVLSRCDSAKAFEVQRCTAELKAELERST